MQTGDLLLEVDRLSVGITIAGRAVNVVQDVSLQLHSGETVALVGESGCGKSVTSLAIMGLLPRPVVHVSAGQVLLHQDGRATDLLTLKPAGLAAIRGNDVAMVFQEPMTTLNPLHRIGDQIAESLRIHRGLGRAAVRMRAAALLDRVGISDPASRLDSYPHELSGGMRQRVVIAMALACDPMVLIADEATTALDVTVQAQILDLLRDIRDATGMGMLFITHDFGVVAEIAQRVVVMYAGEVVEEGDVRQVLKHPLHPYTQGLIASLPRIDRPVQEGTFYAIGGRVPEPGAMPEGCRFRPRCLHARADVCTLPQTLQPTGEGRQVRCIRWHELETPHA